MFVIKMISGHEKEFFSSRKDYVALSKIQSFEVMEYTNKIRHLPKNKESASPLFFNQSQANLCSFQGSPYIYLCNH
ncbi:hypothetical protein A616_26140 [Brevibacillus brevis X23]|nr:hypothetical protein A616_26140 [Brevibacillus brevis X23]